MSRRVQAHCVYLPYLTDPKLASILEAALTSKENWQPEKRLYNNWLVGLDLILHACRADRPGKDLRIIQNRPDRAAITFEQVILGNGASGLGTRDHASTWKIGALRRKSLSIERFGLSEPFFTISRLLQSFQHTKKPGCQPVWTNMA